jgi:hypothetical protein
MKNQDEVQALNALLRKDLVSEVKEARQPATRTAATQSIPNPDVPLATPELIIAIREILAINAQPDSESRRDARRKARKVMRVWLEAVGAAPKRFSGQMYVDKQHIGVERNDHES